MRSMKEILDAQRFLEKYANTPVFVVDEKQANDNLRRLGILTADGRIASKYNEIIIHVDR